MKGIKMFFGVLAAASLLFSVNAYAQENANRDENGKVVRGAYETNKAFDNTYIELGAGINSVMPSLRQPKIPFLQTNYPSFEERVFYLITCYTYYIPVFH